MRPWMTSSIWLWSKGLWSPMGLPFGFRADQKQAGDHDRQRDRPDDDQIAVGLLDEGEEQTARQPAAGGSHLQDPVPGERAGHAQGAGIGREGDRDDEVP